jgi:uncharacterized protein (DUF305 family)
MSRFQSIGRGFVFVCLVALAPAPALASGPASDPSAAAFEKRFLTDMIDHHSMAVEMAMMCEERATHPELRALCSEMRTMQTQEIQTMQSWLSSWYGMTHTHEMTPGMQKMMDRLRSLSGDEFEIEFLRTMIRHHETAVRKSRQCQRQAEHQDLIDLCRTMEQAQSQEIEQMHTWLCTWYSMCK